ncbi:MAG: hypothetical protein ACFB0D_17005 [Phormidesmis sp.]
MLKKFSFNTGFSLEGFPDDSVWNIKFLSAIALFGILLSLSDSSRSLRQTGQAIALFSGGAAIATRLQKDGDLSADRQLRKELQTLREQQAADLLANEEEQQQVLCELYESAIAEATLITTAVEANTASQAEIEEAQTRIAELEAAIAQKTTLATEMLTELEAEATSTFNQFSAKITAQDTLINNLHRQIESLSATNTALTAQQTNEVFASIGSDTTKSHHLLNQLVKN